MINGPHQIFVKRHRGPSGYHDEVFHDDEHVLRTLTKILDDASSDLVTRGSKFRAASRLAPSPLERALDSELSGQG